MTLQKLDKVDWRKFCENVSKGLAGKRAEIEIASPTFGVQREARWLPIIGLVYDPRKDTFQIILDGLNHTIFRPRDLYVEFGLTGVDSLGILDEDSTLQIILLRDPLMLPPPTVFTKFVQ